jgi:hypothetical protein
MEAMQHEQQAGYEDKKWDTCVYSVTQKSYNYKPSHYVGLNSSLRIMETSENEER